MQKGIRNAVLNGRGYLSFGTNAPAMHTRDDQEQFYANETKQFYLQNLKWSSDMVLAQVQGINYDDFYAYTPLRIRTAQLIDPTTGNNLGDDWRRIIIEDAEKDFIPRGAKVVFNGNTWLVTNPDNVASVTGTAVIRRCNATWNHLDWYGNVLSEPFCYGQGGNDLATANNVKINMILMDAYQHCVMQLNPETAELAHNRRILLGDQAYAVRGLQNFAQEFSEDQESVHIQFFDVTREETLHAIDDVVRHIADGKGFDWQIRLNGTDALQVGKSYQFSALSVRNGINMVNGGDNSVIFTALTVNSQTGAVEWGLVQPNGQTFIDENQHLYTTQEVQGHEISYIWKSSDEAVATVDESGTVTGVGEGTAIITCFLAQNTEKQSSMNVTVTAEETGSGLKWVLIPPARLAQFQTATFEAALFENGEQTESPVEYMFSGADESCYETIIEGNAVTLTAYTIPYKPLSITAKCGDETIDAEIELAGW